jgi:hypothetical protein
MSNEQLTTGIVSLTLGTLLGELRHPEIPVLGAAITGWVTVSAFIFLLAIFRRATGIGR